jgi:hypothetical protein
VSAPKLFKCSKTYLPLVAVDCVNRRGRTFQVSFDPQFRPAPSPSGKAEVCKTSIPGSNPGGASKILRSIPVRWVTVHSGHIGNTFGSNGFSMGSIRQNVTMGRSSSGRCFSTARSPPHGTADANATVYSGMRSPIHEGGSVRTGGVEVYDSRSAQIRIFPIRRDHSDAIELGE